MRPAPSNQEPAPWPEGLPRLAYWRHERIGIEAHRRSQSTGPHANADYDPALDPYESGYPTCIRPVAYLSLADVLWATRVLMAAVQDNITMTWPHAPSRDEGQVALLVKNARARGDADVFEELLLHETPRSVELRTRYRDAVLISENAIAHEVLLHAFDLPSSLAVVSSMQQLGLDAFLTPADDLLAAFALIDRPEWFDGLRLGGTAPSRVRHLFECIGDEKFTLLLALGWDYTALTRAAADPDRLDVDALHTLRALRT